MPSEVEEEKSWEHKDREALGEWKALDARKQNLSKGFFSNLVIIPIFEW